MKSIDDFDLDIVKISKEQGQPIEPIEVGTEITSVSLCTPGCITGILMCLTSTCGCDIKR